MRWTPPGAPVDDLPAGMTSCVSGKFCQQDVAWKIKEETEVDTEDEIRITETIDRYAHNATRRMHRHTLTREMKLMWISYEEEISKNECREFRAQGSCESSNARTST